MAEEEKEEKKVEPPEPYVERPQKIWRRNPKFTKPVHEEVKK
tara:strand:- start:3489 stop:3614 length:126 start_codon:yes stop_codon:yes gene_type:complete